MWAEQSVFYQIYPLGAVGAPFENDHQLVHRLSKIEEWIDDLSDLGIDAVLLNPLFQSETHGYNTTDFFTVDNRLGDREDLIHLIDRLHDNGIRVVFDAVFNHTGKSFFAYQDVLNNRQSSPYKDWFIINFKDQNHPDGFKAECWEGVEELVRLNLKNPDVIQYLFAVVDEWIDTYHVDGLRLDVAYCLDRDFLKQLHKHVKEKHPDFFLLGETLHGDYNQWMNEEMLDSVTNYECYKGIYSSFNSHNLFEILYSLNRQFGKENWCLYTGKHPLSFLDNHDVTRIATILDNPNLLPCAYALLMSMPGIPCIYYGSEWGMEGRKEGNDTAIRPAVDHLVQNELSREVAKLIALRKDHPAFWQGDYQQIALSNEWCIFERKTQEEQIWCALNISDQPVSIPVSAQTQAIVLAASQSELENQTIEIDGHLDLPGQSYCLLRLK